MTAIPVKLKVGLEMLSEARQYEFDAVYGLLCKVLGNVLANPTEDKFKKLRTTNDKIKNLLAQKGVRALLIGAGFAEQGEFLVIPEGADLAAVQAALTGLQEQLAARERAQIAAKEQQVQQRKEKEDKENEQRKLQKMQIDEDFEKRKEPGWKARVVDTKDGKSITSCGDVGACGGGG